MGDSIAERPSPGHEAGVPKSVPIAPGQLNGQARIVHFEVTSTRLTTFTRHDLEDGHLGVIFEEYTFGDSARVSVMRETYLPIMGISH
jgi:hypothetical protein